MMSHLYNHCVREFLILARTWFAFGLPSKTWCDSEWASGCNGVVGHDGSFGPTRSFAIFLQFQLKSKSKSKNSILMHTQNQP
jgi:hypothetical protein